MYAFMKSIQIGSAATAPVSLPPSDFFSSKPTQTPTVMSGSKPMNQASVLSSTVPVLPASGQLSRHAGGARAGAALDDAAQQVGHHERRVGADDVDRLRRGSLRAGCPRDPCTLSTSNGFIRTP